MVGNGEAENPREIPNLLKDAMLVNDILRDDGSFNFRQLKKIVRDVERTVSQGPHVYHGLLFHQYLSYLLRRKEIMGHQLVGNHLKVSSDGAVNLRRFLFVYILWLISKLIEGNEYSVAVAFDFHPNLRDWNVIGRIKVGRFISYEAIMRLYVAILSHFISLSNSGENPIFSEDYDRLLFEESGQGLVQLDFTRLSVLTNGRKWDPMFDTILEKIYPEGGVQTLRNNDNYCLLYCVLMGLISENAPGFCLNRNSLSIDMETSGFFARIRTDSRNLSSIFENMEIRRFLDDIADRPVTLKEFSEMMEKVENLFFPSRAYGLEVYIMDVENGGKPKILPVFTPRGIQRNRIRVLAVRLNNSLVHFYLITNYRKAISSINKGVIFWTCAKCHQTFLKKSLLLKHTCPVNRIGEEGQYEWSTLDDKKNSVLSPVEKGRCEVCRLRFSKTYFYEYHKAHCFMKGRRGTKYVQLEDEPVLCGEKPRQNLIGDNLCFADFESTIDSETGEHKIMSWGLYDSLSREYKQGTDLGVFLKDLLEKAKEHTNVRVFFHNAMNYDANFILRYVLREKERYKDWIPDVIMESANRLKKLEFSITCDVPSTRKTGPRILRKNLKICIADTFKFFTMSLDNIVKSIRKDENPSKGLTKEVCIEQNQKNFPRFFETFQRRYRQTEENINRVLRKNLFPYLFFRDSEKLNVPIAEFDKIFEPREENLQFFSETVTISDLEKNHNEYLFIRETYGCQTAGDYHDVYLMCDVLQIADVFLRARTTLNETHKIDIASFLGMPSASWAAFLCCSPDMRIDLYENTIFAEFFQGMTRGGVTSAPLRYAQADETHTILYLDVNGLYPYVMSKYPYPTGDFIWESYEETEIADIDRFLEMEFTKMSENGSGCCFCVDMFFPRAIHDLIDEFPFAPEHRMIKDEFFDENGEMYPFLKEWSEVNEGEKMKPFTGLVATLFPRVKYSVHWRLLQWYVRHGAKVTRIYHIVKFKEGKFLAKYVDRNIELRNAAPSEDALSKMLFKLMSNSVYGKTFENPFNRANFAIMLPFQFTALMEEGKVLSFAPIPDTDYIIVRIDGDEIRLNKPTYIGACVTEHAKLHMYEMYYDKIKKWYPRTQLIYTDTDSVIIRIEHSVGHNVLDWLKTEHPEFIGALGGQVKSETPDDDPIQEVIALRSKVYAYKLQSGYVGKRAKGTTTAAQILQINWDTYKDVLLGKRDFATRNSLFQRSGFSVSSGSMIKKSLTANDGKRFICDDGIHTHAWGYNS